MPKATPEVEARRRHQLRVPTVDDLKTDECSKAAEILTRTHESADALLKAFSVVRQAEKAKRGMSTDEQQDLLRAMLVMAAAGLDSMLKRLIRDAMPGLAKVSATVSEGLETFITRSIANKDSASFLARALAASSPQAQVIEAYIDDLTGGSLQSPEELSKTMKALGLSAPNKTEIESLRKIFDIRNKIIHELDINFETERRRRNVRGRKEMMIHTTTLLTIGESILQRVDGQLSAASKQSSDNEGIAKGVVS